MKALVTGAYRSEELLADWALTVRSDSLFGRAGLGAEFFLRPAGIDTFTVSGTRITFVRTAGRVAGLTLDNRGLRHFRLDRLGAAR